MDMIQYNNIKKLEEEKVKGIESRGIIFLEEQKGEDENINKLYFFLLQEEVN